MAKKFGKFKFSLYGMNLHEFWKIQFRIVRSVERTGKPFMSLLVFTKYVGLYKMCVLTLLQFLVGKKSTTSGHWGTVQK